MKCYFVFGVIYKTRLQPIESRNQLCRSTESQSIDYPKKKLKALAKATTIQH